MTTIPYVLAGLLVAIGAMLFMKGHFGRVDSYASRKWLKIGGLALGILTTLGASILLPDVISGWAACMIGGFTGFGVTLLRPI
ncbi:MAG TPA: hypothetical protein VJJ24_02275 [Candidatus Paceibacterota bacterium]